MSKLFRQWPWLVVVAGVSFASDRIGQLPGGLTGVREYLFAPGVVGYLLAGGVHGGASSETLVLAWDFANGVFWTLVLWWCVGRIRRRRSSAQPEKREKPGATRRR